jgi:signal transduction histidine kinase/ActR/RegA family two-component response regulator
MAPADDRELVALVLAPRGRDAALTCELLQNQRIPCEVCDGADELCRRIELGAAVVLVAEEALGPAAMRQVIETLGRQPPWSDLPIVVFSDSARPRDPDYTEPLRALGNVTLLDRPTNVRAMVASVQTAIRSRIRQHETRRAIHARDQFLAMLGHELRNPIGAIRLAVEGLQRTETGAAFQRYRDIVDRQSRNLSQLADDLLDVARVAHGKITLHRSSVDLEDVLRASVEAAEQAAGASDLTLALSTEGPMPVYGDRIRLEQILENLLTNAIKFTGRGGSIRVEGRSMSDSVLVRVIDSGVGVAPGMLEAIFDLFAQVDSSLDRSQGGMGLGLTLVRALVRLHGGDVVALSEGLGRGTEFRVRLPRFDRKRASLPLESTTTAAPHTAVQRLVVVDDHEDVRAMLTELLEELGHQVSSASDGPQAVTEILTARPDVAFVDVGLPGFDGFEVARRVRAVTSQVLLVAVTGYGQPEDQKRAREAGFDRHLTKPVGRKQLEAVLADAAHPHGAVQAVLQREKDPSEGRAP